MATLIETFDPSAILQPVQRPEDARTEAVMWGPNLTVKKGQGAARKTADNLVYPMTPGSSDGLQNFIGWSMMSFLTDANSLVYYGDVASPNIRTGPYRTSAIWQSGIFNPRELITVTTPAQQVITFTPATIEVGDIFTLTYVDNALVSHAVSYTATATTAANVSAGLIAAWNANPDLFYMATASGTSTVVLTVNVAGNTIVVNGTTTDGGGANTQTLSKAATTPATGQSIADVQVACPGARVLANGFWLIP